MGNQWPIDQAWTRERVEARLIATFKLLPGTAVYRPGGARLQHGVTGGQSILTETLGWAALLNADADARTYLWAWARCRAMGESFSALCAGNGWSRSTAEDGRRRAADKLARHLRLRCEPAT